MPSLAFYANRCRIADPSFVNELIASLHSVTVSLDEVDMFSQHVLPYLTLHFTTLEEHLQLKAVSSLTQLCKSNPALSICTSTHFAPLLLSLISSASSDFAFSIVSFFHVFFSNSDLTSFFESPPNLSLLLSGFSSSSSNHIPCLEILATGVPNLSSSPSISLLLDSEFPIFLSDLIVSLSTTTSSRSLLIQLISHFFIKSNTANLINSNLEALLTLQSNLIEECKQGNPVESSLCCILDVFTVFIKSDFYFNSEQIIKLLLLIPSLKISDKLLEKFVLFSAALTSHDLSFIQSDLIVDLVNSIFDLLEIKFDNVLISVASIGALGPLLGYIRVSRNLFTSKHVLILFKNIPNYRLNPSFSAAFSTVLFELFLNNEISNTEILHQCAEILFELIVRFINDFDVVLSSLSALSKLILSALYCLNVTVCFDTEQEGNGTRDRSTVSEQKSTIGTESIVRLNDLIELIQAQMLFLVNCPSEYKLPNTLNCVDKSFSSYFLASVSNISNISNISSQYFYLSSPKLSAAFCRVLILLAIGSKAHDAIITTYLTQSFITFPTNCLVMIENCNLIIQLCSKNLSKYLIGFIKNNGISLLKERINRQLKSCFKVSGTTGISYNILSSLGSLCRAFSSLIQLKFLDLSLINDLEFSNNLSQLINYFIIPADSDKKSWLISLITSVLELPFSVASNITGVCHLLLSMIEVDSQSSEAIFSVFTPSICRKINKIFNEIFSENQVASFALKSSSFVFVNFCLALLSSSFKWNTFHISTLINSLTLHCSFDYRFINPMTITSSLSTLSKITINEFLREFFPTDGSIFRMIETVLKGCQGITVIEECAVTCCYSLLLIPTIINHLINSHDLLLELSRVATSHRESLTVLSCFIGIMEVVLITVNSEINSQNSENLIQNISKIVSNDLIQTLLIIVKSRTVNAKILAGAVNCLFLCVNSLIKIFPETFYSDYEESITNILGGISSICHAVTLWPGYYSLVLHSFSLLSILSLEVFPLLSSSQVSNYFNELVETAFVCLSHRSIKFSHPPPLNICYEIFKTFSNILVLIPTLSFKILDHNLIGALRSVYSFYSVDTLPFCKWSTVLENFTMARIAEKTDRKSRILARIKHEKEREKRKQLSTSSKTARYRAYKRKKLKELLMERAQKDDSALKAIESHQRQVIDEKSTENDCKHDIELLAKFSKVGRLLLTFIFVPLRFKYSSSEFQIFDPLNNGSEFSVQNLVENLENLNEISDFSSVSDAEMNIIYENCLQFCYLYWKDLSCNQSNLIGQDVSELLSLSLSLLSTLLSTISLFTETEDSDEEFDFFQLKDKPAPSPFLSKMIDSLSGLLMILSLERKNLKLFLKSEFKNFELIADEVTRVTEQLAKKGKYPAIHLIQTLALKNLGIYDENLDSKFAILMKSLPNWRKNRSTMICMLNLIDLIVSDDECLRVTPSNLIGESLVFFIRIFRHRPFLSAFVCDTAFKLSTYEGHVSGLMVNDIGNALRNLLKRFVSLESGPLVSKPNNLADYSKVYEYSSSLHLLNSISRLCSVLSVYPVILKQLSIILPHLISLLNYSNETFICLHIVRCLSCFVSDDVYAAVIATRKSYHVIRQSVDRHQFSNEYLGIIEDMMVKLEKIYLEHSLPPPKKAIVEAVKRKAKEKVRSQYGKALTESSDNTIERYELNVDDCQEDGIDADLEFDYED
ncbi:hypothetical protein RCL1_003292 [Eukaryota sp. TZLM3-RCL]